MPEQAPVATPPVAKPPSPAEKAIEALKAFDAPAPVAEAPKAAETPDPKFEAALAQEREKHQKRMASKAAELEAREKALAAKEAAAKPVEQPTTIIGWLKQQSPGVDVRKVYEQFTAELISEQAPDGPEALARTALSKAEQLERRLTDEAEANKKAKEEAAAKELEESERELQEDLSAYLKAHADEFDLIGTEEEGLKRVEHEMRAQYEKDGEYLTVRQAFERAEAYFLARWEKAAATKKLASRFKGGPAPSLSRVATPSPVPTNGKRPISERMKAAIAALPD